MLDVHKTRVYEFGNSSPQRQKGKLTLSGGLGQHLRLTIWEGRQVKLLLRMSASYMAMPRLSPIYVASHLTSCYCRKSADGGSHVGDPDGVSNFGLAQPWVLWAFAGWTVVGRSRLECLHLCLSDQVKEQKRFTRWKQRMAGLWLNGVLGHRKWDLRTTDVDPYPLDSYNKLYTVIWQSQEEIWCCICGSKTRPKSRKKSVGKPGSKAPRGTTPGEFQLRK